jgi:tetratricopeptide (TPR) repeat protein
MALFWGIPGLLPALILEEGIKEPRLRQAWQAVKKNQPIESLPFLSSIPRDPGNRVYYHLIYGYALEKMNKPSEAMEQFRWAYLNAPPGEMKEMALLERADGYFRISNFYEAKMTYGLFLKEYTQSRYGERANLGMAKSLIRIGMFPEALAYYDRSGHRGEVAIGKANLLQQLGRTKEAQEWYQKGISLDKTLFMGAEENLLGYGENLQQLGKDQEAQQYLSLNYKNPTLKIKADFNLGLISLKSKKWDEAQKYFQSALSGTDRKVRKEALFYLAESQWGAGKKQEAYKLYLEYRQTYSAEPINETVFFKLAKGDLEEGRWEKAAGRIKESVFRSKFNKENGSEIEGLISQLKHQAPEMISPLWKAVAPKFLPVASEPFLVSLAEGFKKDEIAYFEILRWLSQHGSEKTKQKSIVNLAFFQIGRGNLNEAMGTLKLMGKGKVSKDEMLRLEARMYYAKKDYPSAVERFLALKKIESEDLPLLEETLSSARNMDRALAVFERALLQQEGNSSNYIKMADILYEKGKKKEALSYYQKALEKDPLNEWALLRSGLILSGEEGQKKLGAIKNDSSLIGKLAKASLREKSAALKLEEIY